MLTLWMLTQNVNLDVNKKMNHWFVVTTTANPYTTSVEAYFFLKLIGAGGKSKIRKSLPLLPAQPLIGSKLLTPVSNAHTDLSLSQPFWGILATPVYRQISKKKNQKAGLSPSVFSGERNLDVFPETAVGDGPKKSSIRVKLYYLNQCIINSE